MVLTGLRGVGKTVLLNKFKTLSLQNQWLWVGTDFSESASISEETLAIRLLTDLSLVTSSILYSTTPQKTIGFASNDSHTEQYLTYDVLVNMYKSIPGLVSDKLKTILEIVWSCIRESATSKIIFSYDEAQTIYDSPKKDQYPVALLLDVFQSIQRKDIPFMLVLTGLPTLFPKLVDSRTFAERMFRIVFLNQSKPLQYS